MKPCPYDCNRSCCHRYDGSMKYAIDQRVKRNDTIKNSGKIVSVHPIDRTYRVLWDNGVVGSIHETRLELATPIDYRALIEAEVLKLDEEVKALEARAEALKTTLKTLDELDKK